MISTPPASEPEKTSGLPLPPGVVATPSRYGWTFWVSVGLGALMMGYGVMLLLQGPAQPWPFANERLVSAAAAQTETGRLFVVALLLHDFVLLPLVFGLAAAVFRIVPPVWRAPIRFALFVSACVLVVGVWGLAGQAIDVQPGNGQVLPNNYPMSVTLLLTPVWFVAVVWGWRAQRRATRAA